MACLDLEGREVYSNDQAQVRELNLKVLNFEMTRSSVICIQELLHRRGVLI